MCGRFTLFAPYQQIIERFQIENSMVEGLYTPSYNVAPSQQIVAVINDGDLNRLGTLRWGLIPSWVKDEKIGHKLINARAETVDEKPSFRHSFFHRRCVIPADSIYEWKQDGSTKQAMRIKMKDDTLFAMAGLWSTWTKTNGEKLHTCTILTTIPNEVVAPIHNRMPVILSSEAEAIWLNPAIKNTVELKQCLQPFDASLMESYAVSNRVNSPKFNDASLIQRISN